MKVYLTEKQCDLLISVCIDKQAELYNALEKEHPTKIVDLVMEGIQHYLEIELLLKAKRDGVDEKIKEIAERTK